MNASTTVAVAPNPIVDTTHYPLVLVRFGTEKMTDAQVESFIAKLTEILERRTKHLVVTDTLDIAVAIDARQRGRFSKFVSDPRIRGLCQHKIADVLLLRSAIHRGAMTAVFWLNPPVSPTKTFATLDEAIPFIEQRFREEGLELTPAIAGALRLWPRR